MTKKKILIIIAIVAVVSVIAGVMFNLLCNRPFAGHPLVGTWERIGSNITIDGAIIPFDETRDDGAFLITFRPSGSGWLTTIYPTERFNFTWSVDEDMQVVYIADNRWYSGAMRYYYTVLDNYAMLDSRAERYLFHHSFPISVFRRVR